MSLATRCVACGTVFRVVQDQLKVSEGWVRCGRCGEVFNALEGLFDLERETAPNWTPSQRGALDLLPASAAERTAQAAIGAPLSVAGESSRSHDTDAHADAQSDADAVAEDTEIDTRADSQIEARMLERDDGDGDAVGRGELSDLDDLAVENTGAAPEPTPAFLRQAETAARWNTPRMRQVWALAGVLLGLLLAGQAALWQRDAIAARWPQALPLLAQLCQPFDCRIEPLRRLDGLAVESSGLTELADNASLYRLQVALRNRDAQPLMTPALDVTLTDNRGEVVARKVLQRSDFGNAAPSLAAGAELTLQAVLDAGQRRISGYSIEIFYP